ncbi:YjaG family protein, partial [Pseudoalteromonas sp.]|nr:YjaG family protein [Pseudoalteromonas sp.]
AQDGSEFVSISKISQATVARFIEYQLTVEGEIADNKMVREHPLMQYEIDVLSEMIDYVEQMGRVTSQSVKSLKQHAIADGQTNIGLAL